MNFVVCQNAMSNYQTAGHTMTFIHWWKHPRLHPLNRYALYHNLCSLDSTVSECVFHTGLPTNTKDAAT